jgi:septum site-determining protein MinC
MNSEVPALDFKSATLYAVRLVLHTADPTRLNETLAQRMKDAGSFFENEPVVIDAGHVEETIDWPQLLDALRLYRLPPIGVVAEGTNLDAARQAGLVPVDLSSAPAPRAQPASPATPGAGDTTASSVADTASSSIAPPSVANAASPSVHETQEEAKPQSEPAPQSPVPAMLVHGPLRSGQRIYARNTDLIVIGLVNRGAEVIADGNVHIYGPLRGKAMAGARGDAAARIFTTELDAELVSVAGIYRVLDEKPGDALRSKAAQVSLDNESLKIEALDA